ncbi:temperature dependent protein affecting M2 dsRNA replication-domain-containing protein [Phakopsora pachyrhizi]|uniref:Temperature dependent protein affecting M2 dsRNA replication-domain-containing protein n=1 Tax=Phakopsora pachyrhizi TaxID=170000 RepID=A0AAV0BLD0_PHAPC|nr:temperature dependent protein affecting M2 dsRNA replication-domain-containing protein [Phakopsora pachyrhizi]
MPVRNLDTYLQERGLIHEAPITALKDTRIGIDAQLWFKKLLSHPTHREPFVSVTGGAPLNIYQHMERELRLLEQHRIKPVFVFQGLPPTRKDRPFFLLPNATDLMENPFLKLRTRDKGWEKYVSGDLEGAKALFDQSSSVQPSDVFNQIHRLFRTRQVEYLVAPYLNWAQLVYLERHPRRSYIHSIYGQSEVFLFDGVDKVILSINFEKGLMRFASKKEILVDTGLSPEQFLDVGLLSGFDLYPTFPPFVERQDHTFKHAIDLVRRYQNGLSTVLAYAEHPMVVKTAYFDQFCRAKCMIKFSLVTVAEEGKVMPLPIASPTSSHNIGLSDVPADLHDVFSYKFPDEVYFQLCRAMISPTLLNVLATGMWVEQPPLCGGETGDYCSFVRECLTENPTSPRCVALGLVLSPLHPFWQKRPVSAIYYFDAHNNYTIPHTSNLTISLIEKISNWNVPAGVVEEELKRQNSSTIDISLCLGATSQSHLAGRTRTPRSTSVTNHKPLEKKDEVVANTIWRFLELRGYLNPNHQHTIQGKALYMGLKESKVNDKLQEPLFLVIEMLRMGCLHSNWFGGRTWTGTAHLGTEEDKRNMLLVMRVLSIVPLSFKPMAWQGPLSRDLLTFNSFLRALSKSMRLLVESIVLSMVLRNDTRRSREDGMEVSLSLPFQTESNTGMGILFKGYADAVVCTKAELEGEENSEEMLNELKADILAGAQEGFPMVRDVKGELNRGFRFWDAVMKVVRILKDEKVINSQLSDGFEKANDWLKPLRL